MNQSVPSPYRHPPPSPSTRAIDRWHLLCGACYQSQLFMPAAFYQLNLSPVPVLNFWRIPPYCAPQRLLHSAFPAGLPCLQFFQSALSSDYVKQPWHQSHIQCRRTRNDPTLRIIQSHSEHRATGKVRMLNCPPYHWSVTALEIALGVTLSHLFLKPTS